MQYNSIQDILIELSGHKKIFTVKDAAKIMNKSSKYASKLLSSNKYVTRIERGKYYINNGNQIDFYEMNNRNGKQFNCTGKVILQRLKTSLEGNVDIRWE